MLKITCAEKESARLQSGEWVHYLPVPRWPYEKLKEDFAAASHLASVNELNLHGAGGVMVKCHHPQDGLIAALYLYAKYLADNGLDREGCSGDDEGDEGGFSIGPEDDEDEADLDDEDKVRTIMYKDGKLVHLPVISEHELQVAVWSAERARRGGSFGPFQVGWTSENQEHKAYWLDGDFPLIVENGNDLPSINGLKFLEQSGRFYIYVQTISELSGSPGLPHIDYSAFDRDILFELNLECCVLDKPEIAYYEKLLKDIVRMNGCRISSSVDTRELVKDLIEYRGVSFQSNLDVEILVRKAIRKKGGRKGVLKRSDFEAVFALKKLRVQAAKDTAKPGRAAEELDRLIGLDEVKKQIKRLVARLKFDKLRKNAGLTTTPTHTSAVFLGSPGTAKTTVARILGKMLLEENVLASGVFMEVSRKDLIGKYLGHTAPQVASIFERAKGGTIFIDEAYSLLSKDVGDIYSDEAMAEIIRQMENNPDTLVIFAGYTEEMKQFIREANPGLRSRLTNIVEFKDYGDEELVRIFEHFAAGEEYVLEDAAACKEVILQGLGELKKLRAGNLGNGRLMRKWFNAAVGFMAEREDNDLRTLKISDVKQALQSLLEAERLVSGEGTETEKIGFHA